MAIDAVLGIVLPAGDPICFGLEAATWGTIGTAVLDAKSALDTAVQQASSGWTGEAATAFESWWQSRSQPMTELGAACETLAGLLGTTAAAITAANVAWVAAAAASSEDAPEIGVGGPETFMEGPAAVVSYIQGVFAPLIAAATAFLQIEIVAALEAQVAALIAVATAVFAAVESTLVATTAGVVTVAGLAAGLDTALVVDPGSNVPRASTGETLLNVGMPVATGVLMTGMAFGGAVSGAGAATEVETSSDTAMTQAVSAEQLQQVVGQTRIGQVAQRIAPAAAAVGTALHGARTAAPVAMDAVNLAWEGGHLAASKAGAAPQPAPGTHAVDTAPPPPGRHAATPPQAQPGAAHATDATAQRAGVTEPAPPQAHPESANVTDTVAERPGVDEPAPPQPGV